MNLIKIVQTIWETPEAPKLVLVPTPERIAEAQANARFLKRFGRPYLTLIALFVLWSLQPQERALWERLRTLWPVRSAPAPEPEDNRPAPRPVRKDKSPRSWARDGARLDASARTS